METFYDSAVLYSAVFFSSKKNTCLRSAIEILEHGLKYVHCRQQYVDGMFRTTSSQLYLANSTEAKAPLPTFFVSEIV